MTREDGEYVGNEDTDNIAFGNQVGNQRITS